MKWSDITSYSRNEPKCDRKPRVLECTLTPHISFKVHKHIYCGDTWFLTAPCVSLDCFALETDDLSEAKEKAAAIMSQKISERKAEWEAALATLRDRLA